MSESIILTREWGYLDGCLDQVGAQPIVLISLEEREGSKYGQVGASWSTFDRRSGGWNRTMLLKVPANQRPESSLTKQHRW